MPRPTAEELAAAAGKTLPDVLEPGLRVVFCGINPGLLSAALGQHFARPGNRFWPTLHRAGFTPRVLAPAEQWQMPSLGLGLTNVVERASAAAAELSPAELAEGGRVLREKMERFAPRFLAVLGIGAYRAAFDRRTAALGEQPERIGGTRVWVLPNPSGLNAHYRPDDLARLFAELRAAAEAV
jgi:TDG/mug DNA glycosylase family protein